MRLATIRLDGGTRAARVDGDVYVEIEGFNDVGALLQQPEWFAVAESAAGAQHASTDVELAPVVPSPGKIICVGANYAEHIAEMGAETPAYPTLFAKFADALVGPNDAIELPSEDGQVDWEGELAVIIGSPARRVQPSQALDHVAGYSIMNDVSMRGYQFRTMQWLQGKTWERSSPFGPWLVTPEELDPSAAIRTILNDEVVQDDTIDSTVFDVAHLIAYVSEILTLRPGDVLITGTPAGVGAARQPQTFIEPGDVLETSIAGLGAQRNQAVASRVLVS